MNITEIYEFFENKNADVSKSPSMSIKDKSNLKPTTMAISGKADRFKSSEDTAALLIINKIESNPQVIKALRAINTPTGKYKLILKFAQLLGVSQEEFHTTISNMQIYQKQNEE
jgi:hypothetical protein